MVNGQLMTENIDRRALTSAIERFARKHDKGVFASDQKKYEELIPKTAPGPGQQYAFEVDLDRCTGCKACVTACHNENGLDEDETWRSVGLVQGGTSDNPALQHVTTACHHCVEPACMNGCPTLAYTKDETTGIVKHLDDQCFGCQYCILKCPYDVPKYNKKRGIVHKCDMCIGRLSDGGVPACARACPTGAIKIRLVDTQDVRTKFKDYVKVPDAPSSDYTYPTTTYRTNRVFPTNMESVDYYRIEPEHSHLPLVVMLVLTQLSVGAFLGGLLVKQILNPHYLNAFQMFHIPAALGIGLLALASSVLHLGRPHLAFRAVLGFRKSWLSREIIAFGIFANLAMAYALSFIFLKWEHPDLLASAVSAFGLLGIYCSVMVYRDTKRPFWDNHLTTFKFFMTAAILGSAATMLTTTVLGIMHPDISFQYVAQYFGALFSKIIGLTAGVKLLLEAAIFFFYDRNNFTLLNKTAFLLLRPLRSFTLWRFGLGLLGGIVLPALFLSGSATVGSTAALVLSVLICATLLAGELLERYLFFRAAVPLKMP